MTTQVLTQAQPIVISPSLTHCHTLTVPSVGKDGMLIDSEKRAAVIRDVCTMMGLVFGGFTMADGVGGWVDDNGHIVQEKVTVVTSYCSELDIQRMFNLANHVKTMLSQDCVMFTADGAAYFV